MSVRISVAAFVAAALIFAPSAGAAQVSLGPDADNTLFADPNGALSNGAGENIFVGRTGQGGVRRGVLSFDVAANVPAGSTINSATLSLHLSQASNNTSVATSLHRLLADWGEGTSATAGGSGAPSTPGDATWLHRFYPTDLWTTPGGDFNASASATTNVSIVGAYNWSSAALAADVQHWLDNPLASFGWLVRGDELTNNSAKRFDSRENTTESFRPILTIDYTPAPEPATLGLLVCGVLLRRGRKRR